MSFFAGLAFFLVGLHLFEDQLKKVGQKSIKKLLAKYATRLRSAGGIGTITSALLQSQAATIVLAISFLGAGLIEFPSVVAIIVGANIGTTATPWIISLLGFKFSITMAAIPILAGGGLASVFFSRKPKIKQYALMAFGFGMAFFGLGMLKTSVSGLAASVDLTNYLGYPLVIYGVIGCLITALMQSSTAMNTISITALFAHIIPFPVAAAIALGAEVGTTVSALLMAQDGRRIKLQAALTQLFFNLAIIVVCGFGLHYLIDMIGYFIDPNENAPMALAALITAFNLIGAVIFIPLLRPYTTRIQKILPDHHPVITRRTSFLDPTDASHQTIHTLSRDVHYFYRLVVDFVDHSIGIQSEKRNTKHITKNTIENLFENYHDIKKRHDQLLKFARRIPTKKLTQESHRHLEQLIDAITYMMMAAKYTKDIMIDLSQLPQTENQFLQEQYTDIHKQTDIIHTKMMHFLTDHSGGIDNINSIIDLLNQRNTKTNDIRHLLGDASDVDDDLISNQMNIFHHLQDAHYQLALALYGLALPDADYELLHRLHQY